MMGMSAYALDNLLNGSYWNENILVHSGEIDLQNGLDNGSLMVLLEMF